MSFSFEVKDSLQLSWRDTVALPQTTAFNLIVAAAYARKVVRGEIDPKRKVSLEELERYHLKPGNHTVWKTYLKLVKKQTDSASNHDIISGLISFDSEANFLYLYDLIGTEALSAEFDYFGFENATSLYPFYASRLTCSFYDSTITAETHRNYLKSLSDKEYQFQSRLALNTLKSDANQMFSQFLRMEGFDLKTAEVWYNKLPKASVKEFHTTAKAIYVEGKLADEEYRVFREVMRDVIMQSPESRLIFKNCMVLNGNTPFSLSMVIYADLLLGSQFFFTFHLHDLTAKEYGFVAENFSDFRLELLTSPVFRSKFIELMKRLEQRKG